MRLLVAKQAWTRSLAFASMLHAQLLCARRLEELKQDFWCQVNDGKGKEGRAGHIAL